MKTKPDYWAAWTHYIPMPILLLFIIMLLPGCLLAGFSTGIVIGITNGIKKSYITWIEALKEIKYTMRQ